MNDNQSKTLERWHEFVETKNNEILSQILNDEMTFHSPFLHKPKGKDFGLMALQTVVEVFENFRYTRKFYNENSCVLEFAANIGAVELQGVDLIEFDENGQIVDFKVMIRPARGLQTLADEMGKRFAAKGFA
ncbi:MAG: nuclear transport factor 2 family protein [Pyrinomonadaceae bacterium]|nr:nuclear transport factor 2 family protein [Pyrinomonadaceae bacterium]